jgi:glucokinase
MNKVYAIGLDIGGTHITAAIIDSIDMKVIESSLYKESFDSNLPVNQVMDIWEKVIRVSLKNSGVQTVAGVAVCMPGPFDYEKGICWIKGQSKYEHFYGLSIRNLIKERFPFSDDFPIYFENDAVCFGKGEVYKDKNNLSKRVMAITIGTGLGACFIDKGISINSGSLVPKEGEIYNLPYKNGIAEDYVSARGLLESYFHLSGTKVANGLELFNLAEIGNELALFTFAKMGEDLAEIVIPWLKNFSVDHFIIGGKIANASGYFLPSFEKKMMEAGCKVSVLISTDNEIAALLGASSLLYTL